jgi:hypothetical protein
MTPKSIPAVAPRRLRLIGIIAAVAAIGLAVYGIADRAKSKQEVQIWTLHFGATATGTERRRTCPSGQCVSAFYAGSIYGRLSGYVTRIGTTTLAPT